MATQTEPSVRHTAVLGTLTIFAIAMAFLESAIVVYLRAIYYPAGFRFPLSAIDPGTYAIELGREALSLVMLATVARLAGAPGWGRFACFAFLFGVWDIWYYIWLKVFLGWPASLLTWDILFLIPVAWIGPVLAPVLVSLLLVAGSLWAMRILDRGGRIDPDLYDWAAAVVGAVIILYTFMSDVVSQLSSGGVEAVLAFVPSAYSWPIFLVGYALMVASAVRIGFRARAA
ncbi:MAG: hypothetical protein QGI83_06085 [Candidatus Latescibacteria bacterium]|nr:hypothetical protein [Candidatus Latescibacterota bacterium]